MYILGIGGLVHDASVALMKDGVIVAAVEEERFARVKHAVGLRVWWQSAQPHAVPGGSP